MRIPRWRLALTGTCLIVLLVTAASLALGRPARWAVAPGDSARAVTDSSASADTGWLEALARAAKPTDRGADAGLAHLGRFFRHARNLVHAEATLDLPERGLTTFALDHGAITALGTSSIALKAADGSTVTVSTDADTKVRKERQKAALSDLSVGSEVFVLSVKEGGSFVARHVWVPKARGSN